jgi:hypothetical protein
MCVCVSMCVCTRMGMCHLLHLSHLSTLLPSMMRHKYVTTVFCAILPTFVRAHTHTHTHTNTHRHTQTHTHTHTLSRAHNLTDTHTHTHTPFARSILIILAPVCTSTPSLSLTGPPTASTLLWHWPHHSLRQSLGVYGCRTASRPV